MLFKKGLSKSILILFLVFYYTAIIAQESEPEEVIITLNVQRSISFELSILYKEGKVYLPVADLFEAIRIKHQRTPEADSISGFFLNEEKRYLIDKPNNVVVFDNKRTVLPPEALLKYNYNLYLQSPWFGKIFGLDCNFNQRLLSIDLNTNLELPYRKLVKQEQMRANINKITRQVKPDSSVAAGNRRFSPSTLEWNFHTGYSAGKITQTNLNFRLGMQLARGTLEYNGSTTTTKGYKQNLHWRLVLPGNRLVQQLIVGQINPQSISNLQGPVYGIELTNTPVTQRKSYGQYTLQDRIDPGWTVELYLNGVLIDYKEADLSGTFSFKAPLVYGRTIFTLKFYSPWGEVKIKEQVIDLPYNFLPPGKLEYSFSAGVAGTNGNMQFGRTQANLGLFRWLTTSMGMEWVSAAPLQKAIPFVLGYFHPHVNLMVMVEHAQNMRNHWQLTYTIPNRIQIDFRQTRFNTEQKLLRFSSPVARRLNLSMPLKRKLNAFYRLGMQQDVYAQNTVYTAENNLSASLKSVGFNFSNSLIKYTGGFQALTTGSLNYKVSSSCLLNAITTFNHQNGRVNIMRVQVEKSFGPNCTMTTAYEQNFLSQVKTFSLNVRYNFSAFQASLSTVHNHLKSAYQFQGFGTIGFNRNWLPTKPTSRSEYGRGKVIITAFLDANNNGRKDVGEKKVSNLNTTVAGSGRMTYNKKDSTIVISEVEAYTKLLLNFDTKNFENIAWLLKIQSVEISTNPNEMKTLQVPITIAGEVSGNVNSQAGSMVKGVGQIKVIIYTESGRKIASTFTEPDGYFSYLGLLPGTYYAELDPLKLNQLNLKVAEDKIPFTIKASADGDIVEGVNFLLVPKVLK